MRAQIDDDEPDEVQALSREQLVELLALVPERYRLLVKVVASTGLRISEAIALQRRHLHLNGTHPHVKVRRAIVKGRVEAPKTKHAKRTVLLAPALVSELRAHLAAAPDRPGALVFASRNATPLDPDNVRSGMLKPLAEEVAAPWAGWHSLRHTYASLQLAAGCNIVQLSRALGHHSAAFTLSRYVHLLPGDEIAPLDLTAALQDRGNHRGNVPHRTQTHNHDANENQIAA